jgi:hypothetical protein
VLASLQFGVLVAMLVIANAVFGQAQSAEEYRVKAAFLFHFAQLVDWPADGPANDKEPFTLCTLGKDVFGGDLESTLQGKEIGTRPLRIRHLREGQEVRGCQVLFLGVSDRKQVAPLLAPLKDETILTVGDSDDFVRQGGMIGFLMDNDKVRFDINLQAAGRAKLKISSRLLLLARSVIGNRP